MNKLNLDSYITVEDEIIFQLDQELINLSHQSFPDLSTNLLTNLRWYFLTQKQQNLPLIFTTHYHGKTLIRTRINHNITNELAKEWLTEKELIKRINFTHHFLIEYILTKTQILGNLRLNIGLIAGLISLVIVVITITVSWTKFISLHPLFFLLPFLMWWLLQQGIKRIIILFLPKFNRLVWAYFLINKYIINKKLAKFILSNLDN